MSTLVAKSPFSPEYRTKTLDSLIAHIFAQSKAYYDSQIHDMAQKHASLKKGRIPRFYYRGRLYSANNVTSGVAEMLDPSLRNKMATLVHKHQDFELYEIEPVKQFLAVGLTKSRVPADVLRLLPQSLHEVLKPALEDALSLYNPTVTEEEAESFHAANHVTIQQINARLVANMIAE